MATTTTTTDRPTQCNLFGDPEPARNQRARRIQGHAAPPGSGPVGETCGTCAHCRFREYSAGRRYYKCGRMAAHWSADRSTDIRKGDAACRHWEQGVGGALRAPTRRKRR